MRARNGRRRYKLLQKIGLYIDNRGCKQIPECRASNCYTISIANQRLNNQTNEAVNAMLQIATKHGDFSLNVTVYSHRLPLRGERLLLPLRGVKLPPSEGFASD